MADQDQASVEWRKSGASADGACVEVAIMEAAVLVRQSKDRAGPILTFTHDEWAAFLIGARGGTFDLPEPGVVA